MPQIDQIMTTYGSQLFWLVITFGLIYFVIGRSMFPKIQGTVDQRKAKIAGDIADARRMKDEAEAQARAAAAEVAEARAKAQKTAADAKAKASAEAA
ncbi:MAG: ATPase, partial [Rhizobium oryzihabitans]